ncbi:hypothetical protein Pla108_10600 [Botrimarina colliarenosi]|uniref:HupE / UreJ protein n=1 Tax=Botrimarina colliarenosi TaxID=2528001 RepID=A0A5C6ALS0_9BACT|nr:HupE/UreJ family protein [Botrimarina colliarenosi]TWU00116.1 hypothetical protein Pla108_10600 [Botrimarina colliarenosi]
MKLPRALPLLLFGLIASAAYAHKPSDSYLRIEREEGPLLVEWDIALSDLELLVGLDADQDGKITWGEVKAQQAAIAGHALSHLQLTADGEPYELRLSGMMANRHSDGGYAVLLLEGADPGEAKLDIAYQLLFDVDPTHRGLVLYTADGSTTTHVLSREEPEVELGAGQGTLWNAFAQYVREGVWHIWIGFDHILFLLALLLPAVLFRQEGRWEPVQNFRPACWGVLKIVSVFTLAHSITLWLAVMEYATPPSQLIESTIALSIVVTALHNLYPVLRISNWAIAFLFGLVHGFGFANVLIDLGLSQASLAVALLGFNVGVELGQMAIVLVFLPLAYLTRGTWFYRWVVLRGGSVLVAVIAAIWFYERAFNAEIIGF